MTEYLQRLSILAIAPNPDQPRKTFDDALLNELADSILAEGLMQPITVRPTRRAGFEIVAGERRWRAHGILFGRGHERFGTIIARVIKMDDRQRDIAAIVENLMRVDITPMEEADAFNRLIVDGLTVEEIAAKIGTPVPRIELRLRLLRLEPSIAKLVMGGHLDPASAAEIARLPNAIDQLRILRMLNRGEISTAAGSRGETLRHAVSVAMGETDDGMISMFGDDAAPVSAHEVQVLHRMERKVDEVVAMVNAGWKDNECVIANRVNPDRAKIVADKLSLIRKALRSMERQLRNVSAQAIMLITKGGQ